MGCTVAEPFIDLWEGMFAEKIVWTIGLDSVLGITRAGLIRFVYRAALLLG